MGKRGNPKFRTSLSGSVASRLQDFGNPAKTQVRTRKQACPCAPNAAHLNSVTHFSLFVAPSVEVFFFTLLLCVREFSEHRFSILKCIK